MKKGELELLEPENQQKMQYVYGAKLMRKMKITFLSAILLLFLCFESNAQQYDLQAYQLLTSNPSGFRTYLINNPDAEINLKGAPLNGADLSNMQLDHVNLSYAKLEGANLKESNLNHANLIGANIKNANFSRTTLEYADFSKSNATGAIFKDAVFKNTELTYLLIQIENQLMQAIITSQGTVIPATK